MALIWLLWLERELQGLLRDSSGISNKEVINYALCDVLLRVSVGSHLCYLISEFKRQQCALNCLHSCKTKTKRKKESAKCLEPNNHPNWILVFFWYYKALVNGWCFLHIISLRDKMKMVISAYLGVLSWKHAIKIGLNHSGPIFSNGCAEAHCWFRLKHSLSLVII